MNKKEIKGLEPYMADDKGNIYGLSDNVLKPIYRGRNKAYAGVDIYGKTYSVHRLVAYAFGLLSSIEYDGNMIDHINEVKDDNSLSNLQRLNNSQNVRKSKGGDLSLPKGVSYIKSRNHFRYTEYGDSNYPKGKIIKSSKDIDYLLNFIKER
tara:strand:+ start:38 stop:493 length:456 start_codon:yes stop_codon:yes gene_type:complete